MAEHHPAGPRARDLLELDIVSHGRRGPGGILRLDPAQIAQVRRTVSRVPEVMVKVSGGARDLGSARAHLTYIDRHGRLDVETDDARALRGREVADQLVADWQLDLSPHAHRRPPAAHQSDSRTKLLHNIVLSMPAGTPPQKVLQAARFFAHENFALQHRYAMVLHTDQPHPHVHLVVKCDHETEPGRRLCIRKDTLRQWREQFAALMREQGVAANATPRQLRGQVRSPKKDPIHHRLRAVRAYQALPASEQADRRAPAGSTFAQRQIAAVGRTLQTDGRFTEPVPLVLTGTRVQVEAQWASITQALRRQGLEPLARQVEEFVRSLPPVVTDRQRIARGLLDILDARSVERAQEDCVPSQPRDPDRFR